jgi:hypothetical protein
MDVVHQCSETGLRVLLICGLGSEREAAEQELHAAGVPLAISDRAVWTPKDRSLNPRFLLARDAKGKACGGVAIEESKTRALPGHIVLKVRRFGNGLPIEVCRQLAEGLAVVAKKTPRVLRLQVNVFSRDKREAIDEIFKVRAFGEIQPPGSYRHTLVVDLRPTEDEIFAAFSKSGRTSIRETWKKGLKAQILTEPKYAERIRQLQEEALLRTGGDLHADDWEENLRLSREHPDLSCIFGLFLAAGTAPEDMVAFSWALNHGDHGEYHAAGSTRLTGIRVKLGYLPVWEMIRWSKGNGADWFDMGGVTLEGAEDNALEGISSFKRSFSQVVAEVGSEWALEPSPAKAKVASLFSDGARQLRGLMKKRN